MRRFLLLFDGDKCSHQLLAVNIAINKLNGHTIELTANKTRLKEIQDNPKQYSKNILLWY